VPAAQSFPKKDLACGAFFKNKNLVHGPFHFNAFLVYQFIGIENDSNSKTQ